MTSPHLFPLHGSVHAPGREGGLGLVRPRRMPRVDTDALLSTLRGKHIFLFDQFMFSIYIYTFQRRANYDKTIFQTRESVFVFAPTRKLGLPHNKNGNEGK